MWPNTFTHTFCFKSISPLHTYKGRRGRQKTTWFPSRSSEVLLHSGRLLLLAYGCIHTEGKRRFVKTGMGEFKTWIPFQSARCLAQSRRPCVCLAKEGRWQNSADRGSRCWNVVQQAVLHSGSCSCKDKRLPGSSPGCGRGLRAIGDCQKLTLCSLHLYQFLL